MTDFEALEAAFAFLVRLSMTSAEQRRAAYDPHAPLRGNFRDTVSSRNKLLAIGRGVAWYCNAFTRFADVETWLVICAREIQKEIDHAERESGQAAGGGAQSVHQCGET